jgi:hypothetical protein
MINTFATPSKKQLQVEEKAEGRTAAELFYSLAA